MNDDVSHCAMILEHAQPRVAALFFVAPRAAEAADEKITQALLGAGQVVFRIHLAENVVARHLRVKRRDQSLEAVFANTRVDVAFRQHFNHVSLNHMIHGWTTKPRRARSSWRWSASRNRTPTRA